MTCTYESVSLKKIAWIQDIIFGLKRRDNFLTRLNFVYFELTCHIHFGVLKRLSVEPFCYVFGYNFCGTRRYNLLTFLDKR